MNKFEGVHESVIIYDVLTGIDTAILERVINDSGECFYTLKVDWKAYDKVNTFDDIPGYDFSLRKDDYVRFNTIVFMTEYLPPAGRENSRELMRSVGLNMDYDMWAFMIEQGRVCQDNWRVRRIPGHVYEHDTYRIKA